MLSLKKVNPHTSHLHTNTFVLTHTSSLITHHHHQSAITGVASFFLCLKIACFKFRSAAASDNKHEVVDVYRRALNFTQLDSTPSNVLLLAAKKSTPPVHNTIHTHVEAMCIDMRWRYGRNAYKRVNRAVNVLSQFTILLAVDVIRINRLDLGDDRKTCRKE